jgi:hypothetical protein
VPPPGTGHAPGVGHSTQDIVRQLRVIIAAGVERGEFAETDPEAAATVVFTATTIFHHPLLRREWTEPGLVTVFRAVTDLVVEGLTRR